MASGQKVTIEGREYLIDELSNEAQTSLANLRTADQELGRLRTQQALIETARRVFAQNLTRNLPEQQAGQAE